MESFQLQEYRDFRFCCEKNMDFSTDPFMVTAMLSVESSSPSSFASSISLRKF